VASQEELGSMELVSSNDMSMIERMIGERPRWRHETNRLMEKNGPRFLED
jgi:hypothetical protein